jgi:hypothetical protein
LEGFFEDLEEALLVLLQLLLLQMAVGQDLENVHRELLRHGVGGLGPFDEHVEESFILVQEREDLRDDITLGFQQDHRLRREIDRLHHYGLHLLEVGVGDAFAVVQKVLLEQNTRNLGDARVLVGNVCHEKLQQGDGVGGALVV